MVKKLGYNVNVLEARNDGGYKTTVKKENYDIKKENYDLSHEIQRLCHIHNRLPMLWL